jgi:creatinine amidohydrolase
MVHVLAHLTRQEIGAIAPTATALVVVAATEQHGPHLDVRVDTVLGTRVAESAAERLPGDIDIVLCPTLPFGASHHHLAFPGAMSLSTDTLLRVLHDLGESLVASGFRRIYFLGSHGGNDEVVRLAARELALRNDVIAGAASYWTLAWPALVADGSAFALGRVPGHAGGFETSLMLALAADGVRLDERPVPRSLGRGGAPNEDPTAAGLVHRHGSWSAIDGYSDDARDADADAGRRVFDLIAREVADALAAFHRSFAERL